jgi:hypothetical protein
VQIIALRRIANGEATLSAFTGLIWIPAILAGGNVAA